MKTVLLSAYVIAALSNVSITDNSKGKVVVKLPEMQQDYRIAQEFLERLEGDYKMGARHFEFDYNPTDTIKQYADKGELPPKNPFAFFPTPDFIADKAAQEINLPARLANFDGTMEILEPSAGRGALIEALLRQVPEDAKINFTIVEMDSLNVERLNRMGHEVAYAGDFMEFPVNKLFDVIFMNPPFSVEGDKNAYITHVEKAWNMLNNDGILVAIVPPAYETGTTKHRVRFRELIQQYGKVTRNKKGDFKESGTAVDTSIVVLTKTPNIAQAKTTPDVPTELQSYVLDHETWMKNIYWSDILPTDTVITYLTPNSMAALYPGAVSEYNTFFVVIGKGIPYWTGQDATRAQAKLISLSQATVTAPPKEKQLEQSAA